MNPKSLENLKPPWKPGETGNPAGKPKGTLALKTIARELLEEETDFVKANGEVVRMPMGKAGLLAWIECALKSKDPLKDNDWRAMNALLEHLEGKPTQKNEHSGADGEPLKLVISPEYVKSLQESYKQLKESEKKDDETLR